MAEHVHSDLLQLGAGACFAPLTHCVVLCSGPSCTASLQAIYSGDPTDGFRFYAVLISITTAQEIWDKGFVLAVANALYTDPANASGVSS